MRIIRKLLFYSDLKLFFNILITSVKLFSSLRKDKNILISLIPSVNYNMAKKTDMDRIKRYVNLYVFLCAKLGIKYTCFTYSILLCSVLRKSGIDAKISFGAKKGNKETVGHCWVDLNQKTGNNYQTIFEYPL